MHEDIIQYLSLLQKIQLAWYDAAWVYLKCTTTECKWTIKRNLFTSQRHFHAVNQGSWVILQWFINAWPVHELRPSVMHAWVHVCMIYLLYIYVVEAIFLCVWWVLQWTKIIFQMWVKNTAMDFFLQVWHNERYSRYRQWTLCHVLKMANSDTPWKRLSLSPNIFDC